MTPDVIQTQALLDYELLVTFGDGEQRRFSMRPYLKYPAYQALVEPHKFAQAHVANGTVAWDEVTDMSPDTLYLAGQKAGERP